MYMAYGRYDICMVRRDAQREKPCICRNDHKTYTWNDVILYKGSMIRVFEFNFRFVLSCNIPRGFSVSSYYLETISLRLEE